MADISKLDALFPREVMPAALDKSLKPNAQSPVQNGDSFSDILKGALNSVNNAQSEADSAVQQVLNGDSKDIHDTMIAVQKAGVSLQMMLEVRNKILEAYQEVMRTQL